MRILRVLCIPFSQQTPALPCPLALPALACGPPSAALSSGLTSPPMSGPPPLTCTHALPPSTRQASLLYPVPRPYYPSQVGLHFPCPPPLRLPYQLSQVPLHCLMIYAITLVFSFPGPFSYFPLSPSPPKARLATPKTIAPLKNNIILFSISVRESLIYSYK